MIVGIYTRVSTQEQALKELIQDVKAGVIDTVLVYKLDRLSRSQKDTLYLIEDVFNKYGVSFVVIAELDITPIALTHIKAGDTTAVIVVSNQTQDK